MTIDQGLIDTALLGAYFFSIVQREVDNEFLGRVFGIVFTVAVLFMPIGTWIFSIILQAKNSLNFLFVGLMIAALS
ncbi:hypothetical protein [Lactobacillus delbrueckii]|uniref:hypothetical protein n=1 Tax=Lactobacillus delbrueckii TaxID=1584 RepID=UPI0039C875FF